MKRHLVKVGNFLKMSIILGISKQIFGLSCFVRQALINRSLIYSIEGHDILVKSKFVVLHVKAAIEANCDKFGGPDCTLFYEYF